MTDPGQYRHETSPSVTRVVVEGSAAGRTKYLRLTINPKNAALFSWERVPLH